MTTRTYGVRSQEEMIAKSLDRLERSQVVRFVHLDQTNRVIMTLKLESGATVMMTVAVIEHLGGVIPRYKEERAAKQSGSGIGKAERLVSAKLGHVYSQKSSWSVRELEMEGLPLYWCKDWFVSELATLGSLAEVGRTHGYKIATLEKWRERHELEMLRPPKIDRQAALIADYEAAKTGEPITLRQLAERHGIGLKSAHKWTAIHDKGAAMYRLERDAKRVGLMQNRRSALALWDAGERRLSKIIAQSGLSLTGVRRLLSAERGYQPVKPRRKPAKARPRVGGASALQTSRDSSANARRGDR